MSIETRLRKWAQRVQEEARERSRSLSPRRPRRRLGLTVAAAAVSVVLVVVAVISIDLSEPSDDTNVATDTTTLGEPLPEGWTRGESASAGVEYWVPEEGWHVIEESLTPNLDQLPGDPGRFIDTIISFATYQARPGPPTVSCANNPQNALEQLGQQDALVSVLELDQSRVDEYPDRRRATGIYEGSPEELYPYIGEVTHDLCYDRANEGRVEPLFQRAYVFNDQGRAFNVTVGIGGRASEQTENQVWRILDSLTFEPRS